MGVEHRVQSAEIGSQLLVYQRDESCPLRSRIAGAAIGKSGRTSTRACLADSNTVGRVGVLDHIRHRSSARSQTALIGRNGEEFADSEASLATRRRFSGAVPPSLTQIGIARPGGKRRTADRSCAGRIGRDRDGLRRAVEAGAASVTAAVKDCYTGSFGGLKNGIDTIDAGGAGLIFAIWPTVADDRDFVVDHLVEQCLEAARAAERRIVHDDIRALCQGHYGVK